MSEDEYIALVYRIQQAMAIEPFRPSRNRAALLGGRMPAMTVSLSTAPPVAVDQKPTRDWVQVARSFASSIEAAREHIEQQRRAPSDLIRAMVDAGLFRLATPRI